MSEKRKLHANQRVRVMREVRVPDTLFGTYYFKARQDPDGINADGITLGWAPFSSLRHPWYVKHQFGYVAVYQEQELDPISE